MDDPGTLIDKAEISAIFLPAEARAAEVMGASNFISWIVGALGGRESGYAKLEIVKTGRAEEPAAASAVAAGLPPDESLSADTPSAAGDSEDISEAAILPGTENMPAAAQNMPAVEGGDPERGCSPHGEPEVGAASEAGAAEAGEIQHYKELFARRLAFAYRWKSLEKLPAKLSVSDLYPSILDEGETGGALDLSDLDALAALPELAAASAGADEPAGKKFGPPRFLSEQPEAADAALRGTATHIFMQFCDFGYVERYGVDAEIERLVAGRFMTEEHAALVDIRAAERFFAGPLYNDMRAAKRLLREVRFNVRLPASEFTQDVELKALLADELGVCAGRHRLVYYEDP